MTALAVRSSGSTNAVSQLHGEVTRDMWAPIWPGTTAETARPVTAITNGVHVPTWIAADLSKLFDKYVPGWREQTDDPSALGRASRRPGRGAVGGAPAAARLPVRLHPRAHARSGGRTERVTPHRGSSPAARCSTRTR